MKGAHLERLREAAARGETCLRIDEPDGITFYNPVMFIALLEEVLPRFNAEVRRRYEEGLAAAGLPPRRSVARRERIRHKV